MKQFYLYSLLLTGVFSSAQIVNIPDANFKNALVSAGYDTNLDGEIDQNEADAVTWLVVPSLGIASLEGIENFHNLTWLDCSYNLLTSLSITGIPYLAQVDCSHNQLTSINIDLYNNWEYEPTLDCSYNGLSSLDLLPGYYYSVNCSYNQITQFSLQPASYIQLLNVSGNLFATFDSSQIGGSIYYLKIVDCPIVTAKVVTMGGFIGDNPDLISLQIGSNGAFTVINNPVLKTINLKDGYCGIVEPDFYPDFNILNNPQLEFVCMDDVGHWYYEGEWFFLNEMTFFSDLDPSINKTYYCTLTPGGTYNTINGSLHYDCAGSAIPISFEDVIVNLDQGSNGSVQASANPSGSGTFVFYTNGNGTVSATFPNDYFTVSPSNFSYAFSGAFETQNVDFCVSPNGIHPDLTISVIPIVPARPGFDAVYKMVYTNKGTETQSGSVNLEFSDDALDFISADSAIGAQETGSISWDFSNLLPFETRSITVTFNVNSPLETPAVNIGDVLNFTASLTTSETDETPADNSNALSQTVVGSFDPNDKVVSRTSIAPGDLDEFLYYTIHFQNKGTYHAENVVIRDLLSEKLNMSTLEVIAASHDLRSMLTLVANSNGNDKIEFIFEGIDLPAEQDNEPGSHGYVTYKIKPKSNLVAGNTIANKAEIYFDYNSAIVTNIVTTTITGLGIDDFNLSENISLYPNPANSQFSINVKDGISIEKISVFNMLGQNVKTVSASETFDISHLQNGTYFVQILTDKGKTSKKLIKI